MSRSEQTIEIDGIQIQVWRKPVKHMRVKVVPPDGEVRVSVPMRVGDSVVRQAVSMKLGWIREKRRLVIERSRHTQPEFVTGASHWVWGRPYRLAVEETLGPVSVAFAGANELILRVHAGASEEDLSTALDDWYRASLKSRIPTLIETWEPVIGERVAAWNVKKMKTRWGSCNPRAKRIWLGLELAKRSPACTEYVLVHEMVHLLEPSHNARFYQLMDRFMPAWKEYRSELKRGLRSP